MFSGTLYPILDRLEKAGWLEGYWEEESAPDLGRPRRKLYSLTPSGRLNAIHEIDKRLAGQGPAFGIPVGLKGGAN